MAKMKDNELVAIFDSYELDSISYNSEFMKDNEEYLARYFCEPYGDEQDGFSKVIATDVRDTVESDMTSLIRVFSGSGDIMVFQPTTDTPEAIEENKVKTQYINYLVQKRGDSYKINHDFLKDIEIQKMGVLHYYMDEWKETEEVVLSDVSMLEITKGVEEFEAEDDVKKVDIVEKEELGKDNFNVTLRVTYEKKDVKIENIPTENFLLSKNASNLDTAPMVGHISYPTRSDLVASGMTEEEVAKFPRNSASTGGDFSNNDSTSWSDSNAMEAIRFRDQGGDITDIDAYKEWSNETVRMSTGFILVDYDGDGVAERRWIEKIGNKITKNIPYSHVPYAVASAILEPHKAIGDGRASLVIEDQSVNTSLKRSLLDNTYEASRPRSLVGNGVNLDDFLNHRDMGIVRLKENSSIAPKDAVADLTAPYIGDRILQVSQYVDQKQAVRAGTVLDSQGLEADQLHQETATRFNGIERAREAKIELVCRNVAETGYRKLYDGLVWTLKRYQDKEQVFMVAGKAVTVKPSDWRYNHLAVSQVGLGAGAGDKIVQQMTGVLTIQQQLQASNSLMVDESKIYNTLNRLMEGLGLSGTHLYFNNPEIPQDALQAQYEQLVMAMQMAQQQIDMLSQQNPLAEAEMIKQQAQFEIQREKNQTELMKAQGNLATKQRELDQKEMKLIQDAAQFQADLTRDYTDLELKYNTDIPGEGQ